MIKIKAVLTLTTILILVVFFSCERTPQNDDSSPARPRVLYFSYDTVSVIDRPDYLTELTDYYQPFKSHHVYFFDEQSSCLSRINLKDGAIDSLFLLKQPEKPLTFTVSQREERCYFFYADHISEYDLNGNQQHKHALEGVCGSRGEMTIQSKQFRPLIVNSHLYMHYFPYIKQSYKNPKFYTQPIEAEYSLSKKKCNFVNMNYPRNFQKHCYGYNFSPERFLMHDSSNLGYTFTYNDSLFIENPATGEQFTHFFGTRCEDLQFKHLKFKDVPNLNKAVFHDLFKENPYYAFSASLPLAGYYVRFYMKNIQGEKGLQRAICVYNDSLEYVGESEINGFRGMVGDSESGITTFSLNNNKNKIVVCRVNF